METLMQCRSLKTTPKVNKPGVPMGRCVRLPGKPAWQIGKELIEHGMQYSEELMFMGTFAFCYEFPRSLLLPSSPAVEVRRAAFSRPWALMSTPSGIRSAISR